MIRIVVAEDQPLILKDLCHKLEQCGDVTILAAVMDGKSAYEHAARLRPDILFTDIKMPFLSGLEVIARLKADKVAIHSVIISGFRDFEYAREAMKLGVDEYLLKPLSGDDIAYVLSELRKKISMKKQDYNRLMLESLIQSQNTRAGRINMTLPYESYRIFLITAGSYPTFLLDYVVSHENPDTFLPLEELCQEMEAGREKVYLFPGKHENERICLMCDTGIMENKIGSEGGRSGGRCGGGGRCDGSDDSESYQVAKRLLASSSGGRLPITVCLSRRVRHTDSIAMEVQIMRTYTERNLIFGKSSILKAKPFEMSMPDLSSYLPPSRLQRCSFYARGRDTEGFLSQLTEILEELEKACATQIAVEYCLKKLFKDCLPPQNVIDLDLEIDEAISNSSDYRDLYSYLKFFAGQVILQTENGASSDTGKLTRSIEAYMEENYASNININEIAAAFSLTPAYFSRMFKKHTGKKPIEFLTWLRMKHACEYFASSDLPVRQVAELCGYSDQFYFSRAFKAQTGKSPSEYRVFSRT